MSAPDFSALTQLLQQRAAEEPGYSAQLAVYYRGELMVDTSVGEHLAGDGMTCVFSCTKGIGALVIGLLVQDGLIDPQAPMSNYWPEFAAAGKGSLSVGQVLSHQAGLLGVPGGLPTQTLLDSAAHAKILAELPPLWPLGQGTLGYHAITMGVLMEELVRRVTGQELAEVYERRIRRPLGVDVYLGNEPQGRYREVLPAQPTPGFTELDGFVDPFAPAGLAVNSASGFEVETGRVFSWEQIANSPRVRAAAPTSMGAVGTARGLAGVYAASFGPVPELGVRVPLFTEDTWTQVSREQSYGPDRCNGLTKSFALGFAKPHAQDDFGSVFAYGHAGANSSLSFADPVHRLGFAYLPAYTESQRPVSTGVVLSKLARAAVLSARA
ncbi:serine hydrolase domain-containing protein [Glutamicibacter endophyticus]|uniref:serine hydrolase domain-containing protein n=1 Tax=Glutamicibacter endophyticus TaxID=1522174 RepID=UPI003AF05C41